jgi:type VI secretion system secreted protein Hcp
VHILDLILLEPGDPEVFGGEANDWATGGSLIDNEWRDSNLKHNQSIELVSIHQGMKQQVTTDVSNSARTSGRPVITEFTCTKYVDKTSVRFYDYCLRAEPLGKGIPAPTKIYIMRNSGDATANIMTFQLRDAIISEIQFQSHPDDMPTEQFKLNFTEILWEFTVQTADTSRTSGKHATGWSIARNRPIGAFT